MLRLSFVKKFSTKTYDTVIIGGGHNGLTAAAYLAKQSKTNKNPQKNILVLESRHIIGGAAVTEELYPGFKYSRCSYLLSLLRPQIINELELKKYGLKYYLREPWSSFTPLKNNQYLLLGHDRQLNYEQIKKFSTKDANAYAIYEDWLASMVRGVNPLLDSSPIDLASGLSMKNLAASLKQIGPPLNAIKELGVKNIGSFYELLTAPASKILSQWFESEPLKATLATDAVIGANISPMSTGSSYVLLHHLMGELDEKSGAWGYVEGGMGSVSSAIAAVAKDNGVEIRTNSKVKQVLVETINGECKVTGVLLESGEVIEAHTVMSNATPKVTFLDLLPEKGTLPDDFLKAIHGISYSSATTKINLAVNSLPNFTCLPNKENNQPCPHHSTTIHLGAASLEELNEAYKESSLNQVPSKVPMIEMTIPSSLDKTISPPGKHVVTLFVQWTPYEYFSTTNTEVNEARKSKLASDVFKIIDSYCPGFEKSIEHVDVLTPPDLEKEFNLTGGNIFHGCMNLDALYFVRPTSVHAKNPGQVGGYRTPIKGYYMCGSGGHPGGGVMGSPGKQAALTLIEDLRK
ncbi:hypothetical protein HDU92_002746 [Lobulomyces angularis]|nr:hypothetical protein HDU92_002746 [Lobulomyces angularis]